MVFLGTFAITGKSTSRPQARNLPIDNIQHMCYDDQYKASALGKGIT